MAELTRADVEGLIPPKDGNKGADPAAPNDPFKKLSDALGTGGNDNLQPPPDPDAPPPPPTDDNKDFRYPDTDDIPEMLRGKTYKEAATLFNTLHGTSRLMAQQLETARTATPAPTPEPQKPLFEENEFVTGDPKSIEAKLETFFQQKAAPFVQDLYRVASLNTMAFVESNKTMFPHYDRFKGEILQELAPVPINETADPRRWKQAYDAVVGRHTNELAREISSIKPEPPVTERGGGNQNNKQVSDELTPEQAAVADGLGVPRHIFAAYNKLYAGAAQ